MKFQDYLGKALNVFVSRRVKVYITLMMVCIHYSLDCNDCLDCPEWLDYHDCPGSPNCIKYSDYPDNPNIPDFPD